MTDTFRRQMAVEPRKHALFAAFIAASIIIYWKTLSELSAFSWHHEFSSHIVLIPVVTVYLLWAERKTIFQVSQSSIGVGVVVILIGAAFYWQAMAHSIVQDPAQMLPEATLSIVVCWIGGFLLIYGIRAWRAAAFPLLFLLLMVPLPEPVLSRTIQSLQEGSTEISYLLFKAVGVPVFRQGFFLSVPGVTIEVAKECSGIRSSIALFITCLLAAHLFLRTPWKMFFFAVLAFPLAIIKNGIRIVTLTLLSLYVDPSFLRGSLHHDGGFVFFLLALVILFPVLLLLQKSENRPVHEEPEITPKTENKFAQT
jgi:exosortase